MKPKYTENNILVTTKQALLLVYVENKPLS